MDRVNREIIGHLLTDGRATYQQIGAKVAELEAMQARLEHSRVQLAALIQDIEAKPDDVDCATNARRVLSRILGGSEPGPAAT